MFRKTIVAIAATAAIAVATLPTSASAHKWGGHHGGLGWGLGIGLGVGIAATALYANTCRTFWETRYSFKRGVYYQVPVTYC